MGFVKSKRLWLPDNVTNDPAGKKEAKSANSTGGSSGGKWKEYIALASVPMVLVLGNSMLVPILPDMVNRMGISKFQSSLIITLFSVTAAIFIPVAGYLSDRLSRKAVILPALALYGIAGIVAGLGALWGSYAIVITARAFQGLGAAGTAPIAMALVGDKYKDGQESEALGLIEAANGTGKVISPILGSLLALIVWYAPFFAFPLFCALSLAAMIWMIKEPDADRNKQAIGEYARQIGTIFRKQGHWLIPAFLVGSLALFTLFGVLFFLSDLLEKAPHHIDGVAKGGVLAIPLLGLVLTAYISGKLIKTNGKRMRVFMIVGMAAMTSSLAAAIFLYGNLYVLIALLTVSSIGTGLLLPCLNTLIIGSVERKHRGMITSLYSSLRFFGVALGPPLFGWLTDRSQTLLFSVVAVLALGALIMICMSVKPPAKAGDAA
ncbi:MFS transporter [Paenibacillus sp. 1P07SE]|uniref:MFS transporter n=1 Tax=Paenibacillus sp. 1P07SE TaxID=3132209 RepID=UPI0039A60C42